eukprot:2044898-Pleurochrysis_carterae.AAC.3
MTDSSDSDSSQSSSASSRRSSSSCQSRKTLNSKVSGQGVPSPAPNASKERKHKRDIHHKRKKRCSEDSRKHGLGPKQQRASGKEVKKKKHKKERKEARKVRRARKQEHKHATFAKSRKRSSKPDSAPSSSPSAEESAPPHLFPTIAVEPASQSMADVATAASSASDSTVGRRVLGAQLPADAAAEAEAMQRISRQFDPSLGVYRRVRASGEIVEHSVSRAEQEQLMRSKARMVPQRGPAPMPIAAQNFTGREKFPSQHPWHGYK